MNIPAEIMRGGFKSAVSKNISDLSKSSFGRVSWSKVSERRLVQLW